MSMTLPFPGSFHFTMVGRCDGEKEDKTGLNESVLGEKIRTVCPNVVNRHLDIKKKFGNKSCEKILWGKLVKSNL
jgi:hypothetical protein